MNKLTLKQQRFCDNYIITGNCLDSMVKAGYSEKYASHWNTKILENIGIKAYLEQKQAEYAEKYNITYETQVKKLEDVSALALDKGDYNAVISAYREQNRLAGLIIEKRQTEDLSAVQKLTDEERQVLKRAALMLNNLKSRAG